MKQTPTPRRKCATLEEGHAPNQKELSSDNLYVKENDVQQSPLNLRKRRLSGTAELPPSAKRAKKETKINPKTKQKNNTEISDKRHSNKQSRAKTKRTESADHILRLEDLDDGDTKNNVNNETDEERSHGKFKHTLFQSSPTERSPQNSTQTSILNKDVDDTDIVQIDWENIEWEGTEKANDVGVNARQPLLNMDNGSKNSEINISIKKSPRSKEKKERRNSEDKDNDDSDDEERDNGQKDSKKRPRPTKEEKECAYNLHKTHLLTLVANGVSRSRWCDDELLQGTLLSLLPQDLNEMSRSDGKHLVEFLDVLLKWFLAEFTILPSSNIVDLTKEKEKAELHIKMELGDVTPTAGPSCLLRQVETRQLSEADAVLIFVSLCRALKLLARLVLLLQPIDWKVKTPKMESETLPQEKPQNSSTNNENTKDFTSWTEIYSVHTERWIPVDIVHCKIDSFERNAPLAYVFAFDGDIVKDVTARYTNRWSETLKKRPPKSDEWLRSSLSQFNASATSPPRDGKIEEKEDAELTEIKQKEPFPSRIDAFHNHPLYVLQRHLKKYETIHPEAKPLGYFKEQPVYSRSDVYRIHTIDKWLEEGRQIKVGEKPVKRMKRIMCRHRDPNAESEYYAEWQTEPFVPPTAVDGKVPKNKFGNVYLYKPEMIPKGCVHLRLPGLKRICRMLNIDFAPAMIGWEKGHPRPIFDGYVVCQEHEQLLREAWQQDTERREKRQREKRTEAILKRWSKLYRALLIKHRLQHEENKTDLKNIQPSQNQPQTIENHTHEFPRENWRYIPERDIWIKVCHCGFQVEFEQI